MINTVLLETEPGKLDSLKSKIEQFCPNLEVTGTAQTFEDARVMIRSISPELVFINPVFPVTDLMPLGKVLPRPPWNSFSLPTRPIIHLMPFKSMPQDTSSGRSGKMP